VFKWFIRKLYISFLCLYPFGGGGCCCYCWWWWGWSSGLFCFLFVCFGFKGGFLGEGEGVFWTLFFVFCYFYIVLHLFWLLFLSYVSYCRYCCCVRMIMFVCLFICLLWLFLLVYLFCSFYSVVCMVEGCAYVCEGGGKQLVCLYFILFCLLCLFWIGFSLLLVCVCYDGYIFKIFELFELYGLALFRDFLFCFNSMYAYIIVFSCLICMIYHWLGFLNSMFAYVFSFFRSFFLFR